MDGSNARSRTQGNAAEVRSVLTFDAPPPWLQTWIAWSSVPTAKIASLYQSKHDAVESQSKRGVRACVFPGDMTKAVASEPQDAARAQLGENLTRLMTPCRLDKINSS